MAMTTLQDFVNPISTSQDTKKRLQLGSDLLTYLENPINSVECEDTGVLIDGLVSWLKSSNFKVAQNGLETMIILADKLKDEYRPYIATVLPATVDRLGDSKDQVRALAKSLLLKLMSPVASPQYIFEKLAPSFSHKNFRIREEMMLLLKDTLIRHGSQSLSISKLMPQIVTLLGDPNSQVRDTAILTLVEIYKHVGEAVRKDLSKKYSIAGPKLQILFQKFDEVRNNGEVLPTATTSDLGHRGGDEVDSKSQPITRATVKRVSSAPPTRRNVFTTPKPSTTTTPKKKRTNYKSGGSATTPTSTYSASAGAADEEMFIRAFTDVPRIQLYSSKELEQELTKIREILSDSNCDWEKRVEALKRVRSVLLAGGTEYDELYPNLRLLEPPFQLSVKDLRSQVVREACISIAYLAQQLGSKLDRFAESLLPHLINLIPNSAKIMSSAGTVAVRFIIQHTHVNRLIPIITYNLSSKSKDIRKSCSEFLDQLLHTWPTHTLEKHVALLQDAIKKGISDADPEARAFSRKAYWGFADHFREQADSLLNSLDSSKQRMLQGELSMSNSSSNNSLNSAGRPFRTTASHGGSTENLTSGRLLGGLGSGRGRSGIPVYNSKGEQIRPNPYTMRSNSAIDVGALRRAKIRAGGMNPLLNLPRGSGASLPRMGIRKHSDNTVSAITSPERISRSRARGVSHSQPSSRSGSPSSRLSYATYQMQSPDGSTPGRVRRRSGIPTAGGASRDGSPSRIGFDRRLSSGSVHSSRGGGDHVLSSAVFLPSREAPVPILAERILPGNKEAEDAVADALVSNWHRMPARKRYNAFDDQSDESETSSVCSDRSFGSFGGRCVDDVADIIHCLKSVQWGDRKEGLLGLQALLRSNRMLTTPELKMITDIFTRLFMDPHMKVFTLFLDTLNELIIVHKGDLRGWLFPLITRILLKLGGDILPSLQSKIQQTLDLVRDSFPPEDQFKVITRFLNDQTQTPNQKVKIALLQYLHNLLQVMDACDFSSNDSDTKIAVSKIIAWTADPKGTDLKKPAQDVIVDLFNLNSPEFSILLNQMSKVFQDSAFRLLRRRNSSDSSSSLGGLKSPPSPVMSIHSPNTTLTRIRSRSGSSQNSSFEMDDTENQMPEDYYHSLRKTSAEIQKYSQDSLDQDIFGKDSVTRKLGDSNSPQDGLGTNSVVDGKLDTLEERFEISSNDSSPIKRGMEYQNTRNAFNMQSLEEALYEAEMDIAEDFPISGSESKFRSIMIELNNHHVRNEQRQAALTQLLRLAKDGSEADWDENFREVLRLLNDTIGDSDGAIRALALNVLSELMQRHTRRFHGFIEMTVLKILEAQKDADRDVVKAAETCSAVAATCLPPEHCVRTLKSIIMSDAYGFSIHQAAIKMITKVVEHPKNIVIQLLPDMMPALIQAYDHTESCVRKAAVFCMVDIYVKVGEVMKTHLEGLNSSKMKLLSVYIKRAQSNMSDGR